MRYSSCTGARQNLLGHRGGLHSRKWSTDPAAQGDSRGRATTAARGKLVTAQRFRPGFFPFGAFSSVIVVASEITKTGGAAPPKLSWSTRTGIKVGNGRRRPGRFRAGRGLRAPAVRSSTRWNGAPAALRPDLGSRAFSQSELPRVSNRRSGKNAEQSAVPRQPTTTRPREIGPPPLRRASRGSRTRARYVIDPRALRSFAAPGGPARPIVTFLEGRKAFRTFVSGIR